MIPTLYCRLIARCRHGFLLSFNLLTHAGRVAAQRPTGCCSASIIYNTLPNLNNNKIYIYIIQILCVCVCVCVCLSSIGGQTAGPIMTKFGTHMRIDLGMVPTNNWPHEWPGSMGSLGPISESGLSCQLLLRAVVWQMTSQ